MYTKNWPGTRGQFLEAAARLPTLLHYKKQPRAAAFAMNLYFDLQQYDAGFVAGLDHFIGPDGTVHLSDVRLAQEEHTDT